MKDYKKLLSGTAGECAVMTQLCLKGWVPSLAYNNCPTFDIFCYEQNSKKTVAIQVKTVHEKQDGKKIYAFPIMGNRDNREVFYNDVAGPYVFVYIDSLNNIRYYILSKDQFVSLSRRIENDYDEKPRLKHLKEGSPMAMPLSEILQYENAWDNIWK